jgi:histidinol-phosphate aminotransferase
MDKCIPPCADVAGLEPYEVPPPVEPVLLSANESPYNIPEPVLARALEIARGLAFNRYPDPTAAALREAIGARFGLGADHVLVGNGGDELLQYMLMAYGGPERIALSFPPTFSMYGIEARTTRTPLCEEQRAPGTFAIPLDVALGRLATGDVSIVIVCSPNNPTGTVTPNEDIVRLLDASPALVLVDEAYGEFSGRSVIELIAKHKNLLVLRTFSKAFSLAGLRVGYLLGQPDTLAPIAKVKLPYNADAFSQAVALAALGELGLFEPRWAEARRERERLAQALAARPGTTVLPSEANFLCVRTDDETGVLSSLAGAGILVRRVGDAGALKGCLRVTVGSPAENDAVIAAWPGYGQKTDPGDRVCGRTGTRSDR